MTGVSDNPVGFTDTPFIVKILDGGKLTSTDALGCLHNPLQYVMVDGSAVPIPCSDASSKDALSRASAEGLNSVCTDFCDFCDTL